MARRCRVLHVITSFSRSSGAAENTKLTLNRIDRTRFEPLLGTAPGQSMDQHVATDVGRVPLPGLVRAIQPRNDLLAFGQLVRALRQTQCDVVHTHNAKDGILARWAAYVVGVPAVHTVHNVSYRAAESSVARWSFVVLERLVARVTAKIMVVAEANARDYLAHGIGRPEQYQTVYSGLDFARYRDDGRLPMERRRGLGLADHPGPWVAWLGRFNSQKDPLTFVQAARRVADQIPGVQFIVCGDDPIDASLEGETRHLVQRLRLGARVHFLGFQSDVATVLRGVDLVMHSSRHEGMGRILCEALACERPVAGTAVDGVGEVIVSEQRGGILVPPRDPIALGDAAVAMLADAGKATALAQAGREWVESHLSVDRMVCEIESVYESVLGSVPPSRSKRPQRS